MFRTFGCAVALWAIAGQAMALSCLVPNMARSFNERQADDATWLLVEGQVLANLPLSDLLQVPPPKPGQPPQPRPDGTIRATGQFVGSHLGATTQAPLDVPITLEVTCLSPWCGSFPPEGVPLLAFLKRGEGGSLVLPADLCPGGFVERPTPAQTSALRQCMAKGQCGEAEFSVFELN